MDLFLKSTTAGRSYMTLKYPWISYLISAIGKGKAAPISSKQRGTANSVLYSSNDLMVLLFFIMITWNISQMCRTIEGISENPSNKAWNLCLQWI